jgi:hypothetical protein
MYQPKLGKAPKRHDHRNLILARYLPAKLPTPPSKIDHATKLPADIGMMGNDKYGDCTIAAAGHMVQSWTLYAGRGMKTIPDADILKAYFALSPNDEGCNMLDVLNYWRKTGIGGDKVEAFLEVGPADLTMLKLAIEYFGSAYVGLSLPDENTFGPWTTPTGAPNPYNGHAINVDDYDDDTQELICSTWGASQFRMSYAWYKKYNDEAYAVLNDIMLTQASGLSPEGFNWVALQDDLAHIGDPVTPPVPAPTPEPTPTPTPVPVTPSKFSITTVKNPNYTVLFGGVAQTPTHPQGVEAAQHAANLKMANPAIEVLIDISGRWKVTVK